MDVYIVDSRLSRIAVRRFLRSHGIEHFELSIGNVHSPDMLEHIQVNLCPRAAMKLQLQYGGDLTAPVVAYRNQHRESLYRETIDAIDIQSIRRTS